MSNDLIGGKTVICLKLISGEELIGRLVSDTSDSVCIDKPFILIMQQAELGMMPYCISASESQIRINKQNIVALPTKVSANFEQGWIHHTSSIKIASPNDLAAVSKK